MSNAAEYLTGLFGLKPDAPAPAAPPEPAPAVTTTDTRPRCNHGLYLDSPGNTWTDRRDGGRVFVECKHCGKFYGYKRNATPGTVPRATTP